jgi:hypothetical protein
MWQRWNIVWDVADSSCLQRVQRRECGVLPLQKLVFPHFLHVYPSAHFWSAINFRQASSELNDFISNLLNGIFMFFLTTDFTDYTDF